MTPKIAEGRFQTEFRQDPAAAFEKLINQHLVVLIKERSEKLQILVPEDLTVSQSTMVICQSLYRSFKQIYKRYFPWETQPKGNIDELYDKSLKGLEKVFTDFEIYPSIINKVKIHGIWRDVVIMQDQQFEEYMADSLLPKRFGDIGTVLTLSKFILCFYLSSVYGYQQNLVNQDSNIQKFLVLLQRVQLSLGKEWKNINLIPNSQVIQLIMQQQSGLDLSALQSMSVDQSWSQISLDDQVIRLIQQNIQSLQKIFQQYCAIGDVSNTRNMRLSNYHKLLKDSGLMGPNRLLSSVDTDLIYTKLTSSKRRTQRQGTLQFVQFLKSLEIIALKIFPDEPFYDALHKVIEEYVIKSKQQFSQSSIQGSSEIMEVIQSLKDEEIIEILELVHRSILYFFRNYADLNGQMSFDKFLKFSKDFGIFPDILTKNKLSHIFLTLASMTEQDDFDGPSVQSFSSLQENNLKGHAIDQHLFVEALAVVSCQVVYDEQYSNIEKICYLMEKMSQSEGPSIVFRELGHSRSSSRGEIHDLLVLIRQRYPEIMGHEKVARPTFQDLASRINLAV